MSPPQNLSENTTLHKPTTFILPGFILISGILEPSLRPSKISATSSDRHPSLFRSVMSWFQFRPDLPPAALDSTVSPGAVIGYVPFDEYVRIAPITFHYSS
jgi:hypothetical protein